MRISTKTEYYYLMEHGLLGNTLRQWRTLDAALESPVSLFGLREMRQGGGWHRIVPREALPDNVRYWRRRSRPFMIDEAAPDADVVLQGEICRTYRGWEGLLGVRTGKRMREAMTLGLLRPYRGVEVVTLLNSYLDPSSRDDVDALLTLYPDATIELAAYPYSLGKIPGRNTLIWECRDY